MLFFQASAWSFWVMSYQLMGYLPTQKRLIKVRDWLVPKNAKELHSFLRFGILLLHWFIPNVC